MAYILEGMIINHADDLLFGGDAGARNLLIKLGDELGASSSNNIQVVPVQFPRKTPQAKGAPAEQKQLRALLGSLQWLVTEVRFDMGLSLCGHSKYK